MKFKCIGVLPDEKTAYHINFRKVHACNLPLKVLVDWVLCIANKQGQKWRAPLKATGQN